MESRSDTEFGGRVVGAELAVDPNDEFECGRLRAQVYIEEKGWMGPEDAPEGVLRDRHDRHAIDFIIRDHQGDIAGTSRAVMPGRHALPVEETFGLVLEEGRAAAEPGRFVVVPKYRTSRSGSAEVTEALACSVARELIRRDIKDIYAELEGWLMERFRDMGFPFEQVSDYKEHIGPPTMAARCRVEEIYPAMVEKDCNRVVQRAWLFDPNLLKAA